MVRLSAVILLISAVLVSLSAAQPTQGFFNGKNPLFNLRGDNAAPNATGGASATVDISSATALTAEFWQVPRKLRNPSFLADGATFFLGNENSYIRFSSYNGTPAVTNPLTFCFSLVIVINNVEIANVKDTADECVMEPGHWYHVSFGISPASSYLDIRAVKFVSLDSTFGTVTVYSYPFTFSGDFSTFTGSKFISGAYPTDMNINPPNGWGGRIDEVRIWSEFRSSSVIGNYFATSLTGGEANLMAYYNFDDNSVPNTFFDVSPNARNGAFFPNSTGQYPEIVDHQWDLYLAPEAYSGCCLPLTSEIRSIQATETLDISTCAIDYAGIGTTAYLTQAPVGKVCADSVSDPDCPAIPLGDYKSVSSGPCVAFTYLPGREACYSNQTIAFTMRTNENNWTSVLNNTVRVSVEFSGAEMTDTGYNMSTSGGVLTLSGTNFGLVGPLTAFEWVRITTNYGTFNCTEASVNSAGNLVCNVPDGIGFGTISVGLCRKTLTVTPRFAYKAPVVNYASVNATSTEFSNSSIAIIISGENFGKSRSLLADTLTRVTLNGTTCDIYYIDDTNIRCNILYRVSSGASVPLEVTIGGQTTVFPFVYTLCGPACANGGKCIGYQTCDCKYTGYGGILCEDALQCSPSCKNGAKCTESSLNGNYALVCDCPSGFTGSDCGQKRSNTAIIVGSVVGGGAALAILAAAIIFFFLRKPARGTKNFIPLEKKDFTKIIYGDQLNAHPEKSTANLDELEKLLVEDDLKLAFAVNEVTQITEADKIAKAMVIIFQDNRKVLGLLQSFIDEEVKTTESAGTLFRSNSMASKMFKFYSRLIGLPYLYITVGPEIDELIAANLGLEVDPEKMEEGTDLDEMRWMLMAQSQKILKFILASADNCPVQFRTLFGHIKHVVAGRFPENVNTTIGGFIFLRFFCPAISSPEAYGILEEPPSASARRLLILITKVLQNLSNDVEFGSKEPYMAKMNDFIQSNRVKLATFYEQLVKSGTKEDTEVQLPPNMKKIQLTVIANHIRTCIDQIKDQDLKKRLEAIV